MVYRSQRRLLTCEILNINVGNGGSEVDLGVTSGSQGLNRNVVDNRGHLDDRYYSNVACSLVDDEMVC
jgi:hypothetical protein